jgi:hypothetical protein
MRFARKREKAVLQWPQKALVTQCNRSMKPIVKQIGTVRRMLRKAYSQARRTGGWRAVGQQFGIPARTAWRIAMTDYEPRNARIRHQLGLSIMIEVPACPMCGKVHTTKRCPSKRIAHKDLFAMDPEELKAQLLNRICVEDCTDES